MNAPLRGRHRCPTCGCNTLEREIPRAPYNPHALRLIRQGATAANLGWDAPFYLDVCRKHGLEPVRGLPSETPPAAPAPAPPPVTTTNGKAEWTAPVSDTATPCCTLKGDTLERHGITIELAGRMGDVLMVLGGGRRISGDAIGGIVGLRRESVRAYIHRSRGFLPRLGLVIDSTRGHTGGYLLVDAKTRKPVLVRRVPT